jgi:hypothetical protein
MNQVSPAHRLRKPRALLGFLAALSAFALSAAPQVARASHQYGFYNITNNNAADNSATAQFSVTVYGAGETVTGFKTGPVTVGAGQAMFVFSNAVGVQSSITDVYFQDGTLLSLSTIYQTNGVSFVAPATPSDLPGGNNLTPSFHTTRQFSANSTAPVYSNGVNTASEDVGVLFTLQTSPSTGLPYTINDVIAALNVGFNNPSAVWNNNGTDKAGGPLGLRIGIHVQGFTSGASESYVNTFSSPQGPSVAPAPPSAALLGIGLALLGCGAWSRPRSALRPA